ncbi:hypothetical protein HNY73_023238 [Argiope bruennichi]|uniref:Uncharacterized protein n=1 Tax=Argiope bruennichi TaxID=94029 RepID=A0A8T0E4S7_ARGBR|nr:hypothetical protein HNY73_023238 [Argiope bruennichi]
MPKHLSRRWISLKVHISSKRRAEPLLQSPLEAIIRIKLVTAEEDSENRRTFLPFIIVLPCVVAKDAIIELLWNQLFLTLTQVVKATYLITLHWSHKWSEEKKWREDDLTHNSSAGITASCSQLKKKMSRSSPPSPLMLSPTRMRQIGWKKRGGGGEFLRFVHPRGTQKSKEHFYRNALSLLPIRLKVSKVMGWRRVKAEDPPHFDCVC